MNDFAVFLGRCRVAGNHEAEQALANDTEDYDAVELGRIALKKSITAKHAENGFRSSTLGACLKAATDAFERRIST